MYQDTDLDLKEEKKYMKNEKYMILNILEKYNWLLDKCTILANYRYITSIK